MAEPEDSHNNRPAVRRRHYTVCGQQTAPIFRQRAVGMNVDTQEPPRHRTAYQCFRLLRKIGYFGQVGEHIVTVVSEKRVAVEQNRAHRTNEHHVQRERVEQAGFARPPKQRADRREHDLHADTGRGHGHSMPFVGKRPGVRYVAVEAGREHQQHQSHLVTLAAKVLARQAVAQFVKDLCQDQDRGQLEDVAGAEEHPELGKPRLEDVELDGRQHQRRGGQQKAHNQKPGGKQPSTPRV